ncbi:MAG: hypothetical protein RIQ79_1793, partial [Verrucomicrobiota bacterium]
SPRAQKAALAPIVAAWGQTDPAAALQWGTEQQRVLGGDVAGTLEPSLLSAWAQKDPEAALRWTEALALELKAGGKEYYPQVLEILGNDYVGHTSRATTADLYSKIKDPALRTETLTRHLQAWQAKDPAAAQAWLAAHPALGLKP